RQDDDPRGPVLHDSLLALGRHGDRVGAVVALETGLDEGAVLSPYLDRFDTGSLGASFNPGNLLAAGHDPAASASALGRRLVYAHATDVRYAGATQGVRPVPVGHGDVDWLGLLGTLEEIGYHDWLVVDGDGGPNSRAEAAAGVQFLRRLIGQPNEEMK